MNAETPEMIKYRGPRYIVPLFLSNALIFGINGVYFSSIPIYLERVCGLNEFERGIVLSAGPLVSIFALIFWGAISDKARFKNNVLSLLLLCSSAVFFAFSFSNNFYYLIALNGLLMFFMSSYGGLLDTITFDFTGNAGMNYGPVRMMGTLSFGLISLFLMIFIGDSINSVFYIYIFIAALSVCSLKLMPPVKGYAKSKKSISYREIFSDRNLVIMLCALAVCHFSAAAFNNFIPNYIINNLGASPGMWGLTLLLSVSGEMIFFACYNRLLHKFGVRKMLYFALGMQVMRYLMLALIQNMAGVILSSLLGGSFIIVSNYCVAMYINTTVKKEMRATGQALMHSLGSFAPRVIAGVICGFLAGARGVPFVMGVCAALISAFIILLPLLKLKVPEELDGHK